MSSMILLHLFCLPLTVSKPGPSELKLEFSSARAISYRQLVMESPYDRYSGGPFISWTVSEDGDGVFWANGGLGRLTRDAIRRDTLSEARRKGKPVAMTTWHFNQLHDASVDFRKLPGGEAGARILVNAAGSRAIVVHNSANFKWSVRTSEMWGVSEIETDIRRKPLLYDPFLAVSAPARIIAATADADFSDRVLVAVQRSTQQRRATLQSFTTSGHSAGRSNQIGTVKMPIQYPRLLFNSKRHLIVSFDDQAKMIFIDSVSGRFSATSPIPEKSRRLFHPINITWHRNGAILVTLRQKANPQRNLQLWMLDAKTKQWSYLGPWGVLGASRNGDYQLVASPLDPKQCWLIKLKG